MNFHEFWFLGNTKFKRFSIFAKLDDKKKVENFREKNNKFKDHSRCSIFGIWTKLTNSTLWNRGELVRLLQIQQIRHN